MFLIFAILLLSKCSIAEIILNKEATILAETVKYIFENFTSKSQGYVGIIINDNDNNAVKNSLIYVHQNITNSIFLINLKNFDKHKQRFKEVF